MRNAHTVLLKVPTTDSMTLPLPLEVFQLEHTHAPLFSEEARAGCHGNCRVS